MPLLFRSKEDSSSNYLYGVVFVVFFGLITDYISLELIILAKSALVIKAWGNLNPILPFPSFLNVPKIPSKALKAL